MQWLLSIARLKVFEFHFLGVGGRGAVDGGAGVLGHRHPRQFTHASARLRRRGCGESNCPDRNGAMGQGGSCRALGFAAPYYSLTLQMRQCKKQRNQNGLNEEKPVLFVIAPPGVSLVLANEYQVYFCHCRLPGPQNLSPIFLRTPCDPPTPNVCRLLISNALCFRCLALGAAFQCRLDPLTSHSSSLTANPTKSPLRL